jgi:hypothetical protein
VKGGGKDGYYKGYAKGYSKDGGFKGQGKGYGKDVWYAGKGDFGKGGAAMPRACFGCGSTEHILRDCPKNPAKVQQVTEQEDVLFIGNVKGEEWHQVPMKVPLKEYMKAPVNMKSKEGNRFKVLEVDEPDDEDYATSGSMIFAVEASGHDDCKDREKNVKHKFNIKGRGNFKDQELAKDRVDFKAKGYFELRDDINEQVHFVRAVASKEGYASLGSGDIVVDSAADESCWPVGQGDAYPTTTSGRKLRLRTANGGEMEHYGQKEVLINYKGGKDPIGLRFQVTDVRKPLLAVRRLVEKGNVVVLSNVEGESHIYNKESKLRIPIVKKGGSFVVEAQFVVGFGGQA